MRIVFHRNWPNSHVVPEHFLNNLIKNKKFYSASWNHISVDRNCVFGYRPTIVTSAYRTIRPKY